MAHHPKHRATVASAFVAFGRLEGSINQVTGVLLNSQNPAQIVATGRTITNPPNWLIYFTGVPPTPAATQWYDLEIRAGNPAYKVDGWIKEKNGGVWALKPHQIKVQSGIQFYSGITLTYPDTSNTLNSASEIVPVPTTFPCYGSSTSANNLSGWLSPPGSPLVHQYDAAVEQQPQANGLWVIRFSNVLAGVYDLIIAQVGEANWA